jgi:hypothetical protein
LLGSAAAICSASTKCLAKAFRRLLAAA